MRIEIEEIENRGRYRAWFQGELICKSTLTPLLSAARVLMARGADPNEMIEMVRRGKDRVDMFGRVGEMAKLAVAEGNRPPHFVPYQPSPFATEDDS